MQWKLKFKWAFWNLDRRRFYWVWILWFKNSEEWDEEKPPQDFMQFLDLHSFLSPPLLQYVVWKCCFFETRCFIKKVFWKEGETDPTFAHLGQFLWTSAQQPLQVAKQFSCIHPWYFHSLQNLKPIENMWRYSLSQLCSAFILCQGT